MIHLLALGRLHLAGHLATLLLLHLPWHRVAHLEEEEGEEEE